MRGRSDEEGRSASLRELASVQGMGSRGGGPVVDQIFMKQPLQLESASTVAGVWRNTSKIAEFLRQIG